MPAGDRDFDGAFNVALAFHVSEIDIIALMAREEFFEITPGRLQRTFPAQKSKRLAQITDTVNGDSSYHGRFLSIGLWNEQRLLAAFTRLDCHWQYACHRTDRSIQSQFAHKAVFSKGGGIGFLAAGDHAECDWKIETWSFFFNVGWRKIHRGPPTGPEIPAVGNRRRDAVFAFFDRGIRQTNHDDDRTAAGGVDLDFDFVSIYAIDGGGINFGQHSREVGREFF